MSLPSVDEYPTEEKSYEDSNRLDAARSLLSAAGMLKPGSEDRMTLIRQAVELCQKECGDYEEPDDSKDEPNMPDVVVVVDPVTDTNPVKESGMAVDAIRKVTATRSKGGPIPQAPKGSGNNKMFSKKNDTTDYGGRL